MSFSPPRVQANAVVDGNQEGRDGGGGVESEGGKHDGVSHSRRWRKVRLLLKVVSRCRHSLHLKNKRIVADVSKSVVSRYRTLMHILLAVQRFKKAGQSRKRDQQADAVEQPRESECIGQCLQDRVRSILYGSPYEAGHTKSDTCCAILLVCLLSLVGVISFRSKIVSWPVNTHSYTTADLPENTGEGVIVTCESYLESNAKDPDTKTAQETSGNMCFQANKLETVTVVMFSDHLAKALMDEKIEEEGLSKSSITKLLEGGLSVTQEANDLIELVHSTVHAPLAPLFSGGYKQDDDYPKIKYVLNLMDFPEDYLVVSWIYDCNNCIKCSLEVVRNLSRTVGSSNEASWVSCFYYGGRANKCRSENRYTGKCKLYPPEKLSPTFPIRKFLKVFSKLNGICNIRASENAHRRQKVKFEPNVLYLNISHASISSIMLDFMEVERGSPIWTILLTLFPTVNKDCTKLPRVPVCNGTSVCNMFRNADSYELRCLDFRNQSQCKLLLQHNVYIPAYSTHTVEQTGEILCPTAFNCVEEAPYFVVWKTPEHMENDALNSFVGSRKLNDEWAKRSGVCSNTYKNVIRYDHPPTAADGSAGTSAKEFNGTMFLETKCTKETPIQPSYCVPTGRYHTLSDNPGADWNYLGDDLSLAITTRVECQRDEPMGFWKWFVDAFGYVLSWIGSVLLVFYFLFSIFLWLRPRLPELPTYKSKNV